MSRESKRRFFFSGFELVSSILGLSFSYQQISETLAYLESDDSGESFTKDQAADIALRKIELDIELLGRAYRSTTKRLEFEDYARICCNISENKKKRLKQEMDNLAKDITYSDRLFTIFTSKE